MEGRRVSDSESNTQGRECRVPARYMFAAVAMLGILLSLVTLTFTAVVIPAMVRRPAAITAWNTTHEVCFFGKSGGGVTDSGKMGDFNWDEVMQSFVLTANSCGLMPSMVIAGRLVEIWSPKLLVVISTCITVMVEMLVPTIAEWSVYAVIASQFVAGLFMGAPLPAVNAMISSWFPPEERQKFAGITLSAINLGLVVSNGVAGWLVDAVGWRPTFYILPSSLLAWLLLWCFCVYDSPKTHPSISDHELAYITSTNDKDLSQTMSRLPWKEILTSKPVWAHITMALAPSWIVYTYVNSLPTYMVDTLHYSETQTGYYLAIPQLFFWISVIASGFVSQWVKRKSYFSPLMTNYIFNGITTVGSAGCLVAVTQVGCHEPSALALLVTAMVCSGCYMGGSKLNHMDLAVNYSGTLSGLQAAVDVFGSVAAPTVNGLITDNKQTLLAWSTVFFVAAAVNTCLFVVYLMFGSVEEQSWNRQSARDVSQEPTVDVADCQ